MLIYQNQMTEAALVKVAALLRPEYEWRSQVKFHYDDTNKRRFYKVDCVSLDGKIVIEYEGPDHYCHIWKSLRDDHRRQYFINNGFQFKRWPYYCQLNKDTAFYFFGEFNDENYEACLIKIFNVNSEDMMLASGFHLTENTPSNFTFLGLDRFISELNQLPIIVKTQVAETLRRYCADIQDSSFVLGTDSRVKDLLLFKGAARHLNSYYLRNID